MIDRPKLVYEELNRLFPNAKCELIHKNAFELVCAVSLSAQTTDERVNMATPTLFEKYPTPLALSQAELKDVEDIIKSIGLYHNKAVHLINMAKQLVNEYDGIVPSTMEELIKLDGVGRKTANVVLSVAFEKPAIAVDTHVARVSKRLGLAKKDDDVLTVEKKLMRKFPKYQWNHLHHLLIFFGRYLCKARQPMCNDCPLKAICTEYKIKK